ncbi:hypothetical protein D5274_07020 [bacterium 1XD42-94]|nr:hypothetical protein [bacterium 1XD42-76]NBK04914.1 hypothetical protein [bacterium 1XD42-94]
MSYEEYSRKPYRAKCACGRGFLQYYRIYLSNDWGQERESNTPVELFCDCCSKEYHYENNHGIDYLVPNGLSFPKQEPQLNSKYHYTEKEEFVHKYDERAIEDMIADMTAPKHRYIKDLVNEAAIEFANQWVFRYRKKSIAPMVSYLQAILREYDVLKGGYERKKPFVVKYQMECKNISQARMQIEKQSIRLLFEYDSEQDRVDYEKAKSERELYEEEHRYDDFQALVCYDPSFKKDLINHYWDSYFIKRCTDSQYLSLNKPEYGTPKITIAKKYFCVCTICGKEAEILSSDFKISFDEERGFYPSRSCNCHTVSSFEAKTMDIFNQLGITYIREVSFEGLVGDSGKSLRFDFALYKSYDETGVPKIDLLIELQGPHHYKKGYYDEYGDFVTDDGEETTHNNVENNFMRQVRYDEKKKQYCIHNGLDLECVKYTVANDYKRLERKIIEILKRYGYNYYTDTNLLK